MLNRLLTFATNKIYNLPVIVMMPHSRCNCRCVMCDIWKANHNKEEIAVAELQKHIHHFKKLGVQQIVFSGGEALMHSNLWALCSLLRVNNINITLLSTGLLLEHNAKAVVDNFNEVIISLDGSESIHDKIRNIPQGFKKIVSGIQALKNIKADYRITARCVLQRYNYNDFINIVRAAKEIDLNQISFLAADVSISAFNHVDSLTKERVSEIALSTEEALAFESIIIESFNTLKEHYRSKFIAESPEKMMKIVQYYKAINNIDEFPKAVCNAPWVSVVIESNGNVMPCFFHKPYGNIYDNDLLEIINSPEAIAFRKKLNVSEDSVCKKCVCSLKRGLM